MQFGEPTSNCSLAQSRGSVRRVITRSESICRTPMTQCPSQTSGKTSAYATASTEDEHPDCGTVVELSHAAMVSAYRMPRTQTKAPTLSALNAPALKLKRLGKTLLGCGCGCGCGCCCGGCGGGLASRFLCPRPASSCNLEP